MADASTQPYGSLACTFASPWYLRVDDNIRITSYNALASVKLEIRYRMIDGSGLIMAGQEVQTPNTDRTAKTTIYPTPEGWLLGGEIFVSGAAPLLGQTFVVVEIVRGLASSALPLQLIAAGYVSAKQPLAFPSPQIASSLDGGGALRSIAGSTPAAGAEISETVPTGARWELLAFKAALTNSATVANRSPVLTLDDGATIFVVMNNNLNQAASSTFTYSYYPGSQVVQSPSGFNIQQHLPIGIRLGGGYRIRTSTVNIQVGDQWSAIQYLVREWLEGA